MRKLTALLVLVFLFSVMWPVSAQQAQPTPTPQAPLVVAPELFARAALAFEAANYERAVLDYSLFLLFNPTASEAYLNRALSYQGLGELDTALSDVTQALSFTNVAPGYLAELYLVRASLHLQKNDLEAALTDLDASIQASPELIDNLLLRARVYAFQERFDDALADYNRALEINPENIQGLVDRAIIHNAQSDFEAALSDVTSAINLSPENGGLYLLRGSINNQAEHTEDAASDYLRWLMLTQKRTSTASQALTSSQSFVVEMAEGWVYSIPFQAEAGQSVNVTATRSPGGEADPLLVIVGDDGAPLVGDDDSGGNMDALIRDYRIPQDGLYTLLIGHALGGSDGEIRVSLQLGD